jgi:hypothetical protein
MMDQQIAEVLAGMGSGPHPGEVRLALGGTVEITVRPKDTSRIFRLVVARIVHAEEL